MRKRWSVTLCGLACLGLLRPAPAEEANLTAELAHVGETMVGVSWILILAMKVHSHEKSIMTYASKIATANVALVKQMKPPAEAKKLHECLREMAELFNEAVAAYGKGDIKGSRDYVQDLTQAINKAKQELDKLKRDGLVP